MRAISLTRVLGICLFGITIACSSDDDSDGGGGSAGDASTAGSSGSGGGDGSDSSVGGNGGGGGSGGRTGTGGGSGTAGEDAGPVSPESGPEPPGDGAAADGSGSACAELADCCQPLFTANCDAYAQAGDELVCATVQGVLCGGGMMPGGDGGITPGTGGCAALEMCCGGTPLALQCNAIVATGNDMQCNTVQFLFCP